MPGMVVITVLPAYTLTTSLTAVLVFCLGLGFCWRFFLLVWYGGARRGGGAGASGGPRHAEDRDSPAVSFLSNTVSFHLLLVLTLGFSSGNRLRMLCQACTSNGQHTCIM